MKTIKIDTYSVKTAISKLHIDCINNVRPDDNDELHLSGSNFHIHLSDTYIDIDDSECGKIVAETLADLLNTKVSVEVNKVGDKYYHIIFSYEEYEIDIDNDTNDIIIYKLHKKIIKTTIEE